MNDGAVRTFLGELVDDAGLFPPARRSMADAVAAYESAASSDEFWMAGRFVVPASRIAELARARDGAPRPLAAAVVVDATIARPADLVAIARDAAAARDRVAVEVLEIALARLPGETDDERLDALRIALDEASFPQPVDVFVEMPLRDDGGEEALLALHRARERGFAARAKIRCGGLEPSAVPSVESVARFVWTANRFALPFKATAGLHEALRHAEPALGVDAHGFLNVIGAAVLARSRGVDRASLENVLREREASAFTLDAHAFAWRGIGASAAEIGDARARFVQSYGSCSFDEPVASLRALGILAQATNAR